MSHQVPLSPAASHRPTAVLDRAGHATEPPACRSRCPYSPGRTGHVLTCRIFGPVGLVQDSRRRVSHSGTMTNAHVTELIAFTIDCSDATRLARFYADLTGGEVTGDYPEYGVAQTTTLGVTLNFQGVKDYAPPAWPGQEHPQQYHLDFRVPDLEKATEHAIGLGAAQAEEQPNEKLWRVMIDPDGHPFCLCPPRD
jgi:Glyoxalase-like domain